MHSGKETCEETILDQTCLHDPNLRENNTRLAKPWRRNRNIALDVLTGGNLRGLVSVLARLFLIKSIFLHLSFIQKLKHNVLQQTSLRDYRYCSLGGHGCSC